MKLHRLDEFTKGWFIGPFQPTLIHTQNFEIAIKRYSAGEVESRHHHRIATEFTVVVSGKVLMNDQEIGADQIIEIPPGTSTDFAALTDAVTVVIKCPGLAGDKYLGAGPIS